MNPKDEQPFFDKIKEFANPVEGTAAKDVKDQTDVAYYSYIDNLLGGIPGKIAKTVNSDAYDKYQAAKEKYKNIAMQGDIAAAFTPTVAGNLINAGLIGKVVPKAGKVAGLLTKIGTGIKSGAILGLEQAIPRALTGQTDVKDSLVNVASSAGLGGVGGAVGHGLSWVGERIPDALREASEWGNKTILKAGGNVQNRIMNQEKRFMGKDKAKYVKEMAQGMLDKQLNRKSKLDAFKGVVDNEWKQTADIFDAANIKTVNSVNDILQNPSVANVLSRDPNKMAELNTLMGKVDNSKNLYEKRKFLQDIVYQQGGDNETKNLARGVLDFIENKSDEMATAQMPDLKKDYKLKQLFSKADEREDINVSGAGLKGGSDTAAKIALGAIVGGGGSIAPVNDIREDPTNVDAWKRLGAALLGGTVTSAMSKQIAWNAAKLARKLDPDDIIEMMKAGKIKQIADLASKIDLPAIAGNAVQGLFCLLNPRSV